jgi:hypothetical protein
MKVKGHGPASGGISADFRQRIGRGGLAGAPQIGSCPAVWGRSALGRSDPAEFRARARRRAKAGGREIGSESVRLAVGAGDDELKRRTWGFVLPRCLAV